MNFIQIILYAFIFWVCLNILVWIDQHSELKELKRRNDVVVKTLMEVVEMLPEEESENDEG